MATAAKYWTIEEYEQLPDDDGNRYELLHGELLVSPSPNGNHQDVVARLIMLLVPYVLANNLGMVHAGSAVQSDDSVLIPDLIVSPIDPRPDKYSWIGAPRPLLTIEVISLHSRRRDKVLKRDFYLEVGAGDYWIVDQKRREVTVVITGQPDVVVTDVVRWTPAGTATEFVASMDQILGPA